MWGTDLYTDDSSVCVAAVHAGAITTAGGTVVVTISRGRPATRAPRAMASPRCPTAPGRGASPSARSRRVRSRSERPPGAVAPGGGSLSRFVTGMATVVPSTEMALADLVFVWQSFHRLRGGCHYRGMGQTHP
ncbi:LCCL domain-containing protein [Corallococcus exiguus]|uniref:LCCL domain-containing protein n=1 Tax=Corallococcus exiguus TaxID=83462 RepID=UPI003211AF67